MRRIWAASIAAWATLALVGGLAWMRHPAASTAASPTPVVVVQPGPAGQAVQAVSAQATAHATTRTS